MLDADLLIHLVDASHPHFEDQMEAVSGLLKELGVDQTPVLTVFNKQDRVSPQLMQNLCRLYDAIAVEARNPETLPLLIARMRSILWEQFPSSKRQMKEEQGELERAAMGGLG